MQWMMGAILTVFVLQCWATEDDPRELRRSISLEGVLGNKVLLSIDGKRVLRSRDDGARDGIRVLSIGSDTVEVDVDGRRRQLHLGGHEVVSAPFKERSHETVTITRNNHGMYTTVGSINGLPVSFLVDTGATSVAMNSAHARRLGLAYDLKGTPTLVSTASGITKAYLVKLDTVAVGAIQLRNVQAVVMDGGFPTEVLLGMSFLGQLEIQRDGAVMRLKQKY